MPPTPSSIISDALNSLSKAANLALATVEDQARSDVARANVDAADARCERDDALKALRDLRYGEKEWERREEAWKASVDKAELTIKHQAETISHLRAEAAQWKAQVIRLEETSRQEIADWKEQYLRAEQDRCRLSSRIDELVAEQLAYNTQANAALGALASRSSYPDAFEPSSVSTKRGSTATLAPPSTKRQTSLAHPPDYDISPPARKPKPAQSRTSQVNRPVDPTPARTPKYKPQPAEYAASTTKTPRIPHTPRPTSTSRAGPSLQPPSLSQRASGSAPQQQVIRRVQATISVPVKEEEDSDAEPLESDASGSAYEPEEEQPKRKQKTGLPSRGRRQTRSRRVVEDDPDEDEEDIEYRRRQRRKYDQDNEADDTTDELAMGPDDGTDSPVQMTLKANASTRPSVNGSAKKRKLDTEQAASANGRTTGKVSRR